jgi:integrase
MKRGPYKNAPLAGSWAALIRDFRMSPKYRTWAPGSKANAERFFGELLEGLGREQVRSTTLAQITLWRDRMSEYPAAANSFIKFLGHLLRYAKRTGYIEVNPLGDRGAIDRLPPKAPGGFRTWREDEIEAFLAYWPLGTLPHLVLTLALYTGAAATDLVKLGPMNVRDGRLRYRRQKTERAKGAEESPLVDIPILPPLASALEAASAGRSTYLETAYASPRSANGLAHQFALWTAEAGLGAPDRHGRHLTLHGLRKALGRRLAEAGADPFTIMGWLGQESIRSAEVYTRTYDRARAADVGADLLGGAKPSNVTRMKR